MSMISTYTNKMRTTISAVSVCLCIILSAGLSTIHGQSCAYSVGKITFDATGQNSTELYSTIYILTNADKTILDQTSITEFQIEEAGLYFIYGLNYKNNSSVEGLTVGSKIDSITGDCLDISEALPISVCRSLAQCDYCISDEVDFKSEGANDQVGYETLFFLTDASGKILNIQDSTNFGILTEGVYLAYSINYDTSKELSGLEINNSILDITGLCYDISEGLLFTVCTSIVPEIIFDLNNCDITSTATLKLRDTYSSYLWSNGSTDPSITVDATLPMDYFVTVSTSSGCTGTDTLAVSGNDYATIGDFVWNDTNSNGIQDEGEPGLNGVIISLYADDNADGIPDNPSEPLCITISSNNTQSGPGYYIFNVYPGSYIIEFGLPAGYLYSSQGQGSDPLKDSDANINGYSNTVTVIAGENRNDVDAGFYLSSSFGGFVWNDLDADGVQDEQESGINGVSIKLYTGDGDLISTVSTANDPDTDEPGFYCIDGLTPGSYYAEIVLPEGFFLSPADQRTDDNIDSDATNANGPNTTSDYNLISGVKQDNVDFGIYLGGVVCGVVWKESPESENNTYDVGVDDPIANTQLELISFDNDNEIIAVAATDNLGQYCFISIPAGSYTIRPRTVGSNAGDSYVSLNFGDDDLIDSDVDPNTGSTEMFFIGPGQALTGVNAGLRSGALPVELLAFNGWWDDKKQINLLTWSTAMEINNDKFIIERAVGENGQFKAIGEVKGGGNTSEQREYNFSDKDISLSASYYYRLKQVDYDGGFEYSPIIVIDVERNAHVDLKVYPNPFNQWITVEVGIPSSANYFAELIDLQGRKIGQWKEALNKAGKNRIKINMNHVQPGSYILHMIIGTTTVDRLILKAD